MDLRRGLRYARACVIACSGRNGRARRRLDGTRAAVLMYHRVLPIAEAARKAAEPGMVVSPETFGRHLEWLAAAFRVLPLHEIVSRLAGGLPLPAGACAITFDDGWRDNLEFGLPALQRRGLPATIFVVTDRIGSLGAFWPDEVCRRMATLASGAQRELGAALGISAGGDPIQNVLAHLKSLREESREEVLLRIRAATRDASAPERELLDWSELDQLARGGVDVEAHGATHAILTRVSAGDADRELRSARERLRERGHGRRGLLAYPSGAYDERVRGLAGAAGYTAAFTTEIGLADAQRDRLALPRIGLHDDVSRTRVEFLQHVPGTA